MSRKSIGIIICITALFITISVLLTLSEANHTFSGEFDVLTNSSKVISYNMLAGDTLTYHFHYSGHGKGYGPTDLPGTTCEIYIRNSDSTEYEYHKTIAVRAVVDQEASAFFGTKWLDIDFDDSDGEYQVPCDGKWLTIFTNSFSDGDEKIELHIRYSVQINRSFRGILLIFIKNLVTAAIVTPVIVSIGYFIVFAINKVDESPITVNSSQNTVIHRPARSRYEYIVWESSDRSGKSEYPARQDNSNLERRSSNTRRLLKDITPEEAKTRWQFTRTSDTCWSCGTALSADTMSCPSCSEKRIICLVCRRNVNRKDRIGACSACGNYFHYEHLKEVVKISGRCPMCRQELKTDKIRELGMEKSI